MIVNSITRRNLFIGSFMVVFLMLATTAHSSGQTTPEPAREKLLNGLDVLLWQRRGDPDVLFKLRIHSGAAFDLAGKAGMMALLGDALFPDAATKEYVTEQLGGRLDVTTTQDFTEITLSGKASEIDRMIDLLRGAVLTPQLGANNIATLRSAVIKSLADNAFSATTVADDAIAQRLYGSFPYAHPSRGTVATVTKIDRGDLAWARERFLNADNATLVVIGGFERDRLMRALRQLLGPWGKGDKIIPATFRQPAAPDSRALVIEGSNSSQAEIRLAVRGLSRSDHDDIAATILAQIIQYRWQLAMPDLSSVSVRHGSHLLPGIFVIGASAPTGSSSKAVSAAQEIITSLMQNGPTPAELERAQAEVLSNITKGMSQPAMIADAWLDAESFKSPSLNSLAVLARELTANDVKRVAVRLFKETPVATVIVGNIEELKTAFAGHIELQSAAPPQKSTVDPVVPTKKP